MTPGPSSSALFGTAALAALFAAYLLRRNRPPKGDDADPTADFLARAAPFPGDPRKAEGRIYTDHVNAGAYKASMGLAALDPDSLFELTSSYPHLSSLRRAALAQHPDEVHFMLPHARDACAEYLELVAGYLCRRYPTLFETTNGGKGLKCILTGREWDLAGVGEPLRVVAELVPDDAAVLLPDPTPQDPEGEGMRFAAGVVIFSFPGSMLRAKVGLKMHGVHLPVPGFNARLLRPVDSYLSSQRAPSHRLNWTLQVGGEHHRPGHTSSAAPPDTEPAIGEVHFQVERQTFLRLPRTGGLVFGVRVHIWPLGEVLEATKEGDFARRLYSALRNMPEEFVRYKNLVRIRPVVIRHLEEAWGMTDADVEPAR